MRYRELGRTGMFVSEICLGAAAFGASDEAFWSGIAGVDQATTSAIVSHALDAGINFFDTSDVYSRGASEKALGQALKEAGAARKDVVLATKVGSVMGEGPNDKGSSRGHIMDSVAQSLERLQTDHIDLYQLHNSDSITPTEEILRAMDDLVNQGLVRYVGVSNWRAWRVARALGLSEHRGYARVQSNQVYYNLAARDIEREFVSLHEAEGISLTIWSPLARGFLTGKYERAQIEAQRAEGKGTSFPIMDEERGWRVVAVLREIAARHGALPGAVSLAWILSRRFVTSVIVGARTVEQLDQNLAATGVKLDEDDLERLDKASALPVEYPGWIIARHDADRRPKPFDPPKNA
jgi:aryl-alcohol dehydrogenase-like predicted oxidoreductase